MSDGTPTNSATTANGTTTDLQFDRAEFAGGAPAAPACAFCQNPIDGTYFEVNGQTTCASCRDKIAQAHAAQGGPGAAAPFLALAAGGAAGICGAMLYYLVVKVTGYELGLIAVVVGWMVGRAVRWGSGNRGGASYQAMAIVITYLAIVSTYVPFLFEAARDTRATPQAVSQTASQTAQVEQQQAAPAPTGSATPAAAPSATQAAPAPATAAAQDGEPETEHSVFVALLMLVGVLLALPFLAGFSNIIGWVIIGFALYEAWKINRRAIVTITGPFAIAPQP